MVSSMNLFSTLTLAMAVLAIHLVKGAPRHPTLPDGSDYDMNLLADHLRTDVHKSNGEDQIDVSKRDIPVEGILIGKREYPMEGILIGKREYPMEGILLGRRDYPTKGIMLGKRHFRFLAHPLSRLSAHRMNN